MEPQAEAMQQVSQVLNGLVESPLYEYRQKNGYHPVLGEGHLRARLMFIGEAPGEREAKTGQPFVGASGKFLDVLLESIGLQRQQVYITNIVKDRPPENRDPTPEELRLYAPLLLRQIEIIQPAIIATLGRFSMDFILERFDLPQKGQKIGTLHGKPVAAKTSYGPVTVIPLYHPAVALYNGELRTTLLQDFQTLKNFLT